MTVDFTFTCHFSYQDIQQMPKDMIKDHIKHQQPAGKIIVAALQAGI